MKKAFTINCMRTKEDFVGFNKILNQGIYQGIEIFYPYNVTQEQASFYTKEIHNIIKLNPSIEVVLHLPHGIKNSLTDEYLQDSILLMKDAIDYAKDFGVKKLTLHLGSVKPNKKRSVYIKEISQVLKELCDYASKDDMVIMIENMPSNSELGVSPEEILQIIEVTSRENLKFILDTGHAFVAKIELTEFVYKLKKYLVHIHFNDNDGMKDEHKQMFLGKIDFYALFEVLKAINYNELHCMEVIFKKYTELIDFAKDLAKFEE